MTLPLSGHWKCGVGPGGAAVAAAGLSGVGSPAAGDWRGGAAVACWPDGGASSSFLTAPPEGPPDGAAGWVAAVAKSVPPGPTYLAPGTSMDWPARSG